MMVTKAVSRIEQIEMNILEVARSIFVIRIGDRYSFPYAAECSAKVVVLTRSAAGSLNRLLVIKYRYCAPFAANVTLISPLCLARSTSCTNERPAPVS